MKRPFPVFPLRAIENLLPRMVTLYRGFEDLPYSRTASSIMTLDADTSAESQPFQAEVAELLHLMVHSVYSETDIFLRELISNASDACDKLRYEAIANPGLIADGAPPPMTRSRGRRRAVPVSRSRSSRTA